MSVPPGIRKSARQQAEQGAIGLPPGNDSAEFVFNEWPDGIDAVVCGLDGDGRPD